jgi:hypothetical protein
VGGDADVRFATALAWQRPPFRDTMHRRMRTRFRLVVALLFVAACTSMLPSAATGAGCGQLLEPPCPPAPVPAPPEPAGTAVTITLAEVEKAVSVGESPRRVTLRGQVSGLPQPVDQQHLRLIVRIPSYGNQELRLTAEESRVVPNKGGAFVVRFRPPVTAAVQVVTDDPALEGLSPVRTVRIQEHNHVRVTRTSSRRARFHVTFDGPTRVPLEPNGATTRLGSARQAYLYAGRVGRPYLVLIDRAPLRFQCNSHGCHVQASGSFPYSHRVAWASGFLVCTRADVFVGVGTSESVPDLGRNCGRGRV